MWRASPKDCDGPYARRRGLIVDWLVFIDTNIFLDFYRIQGKQQQGLSVLDHLKDNYDHFITSSQVEMEFKKNRQPVIIDAFKPIAKLAPETKKVLPAFLEEFRAASSLLKAEKQMRKSVQRLRETTSRILEDPTKHDDVYKKVQRLFAANTPHNLNRVKEERLEIRSLARRRFDLGYPPRKGKDTSIGDAINWGVDSSLCQGEQAQCRHRQPRLRLRRVFQQAAHSQYLASSGILRSDEYKTPDSSDRPTHRRP